MQSSDQDRITRAWDVFVDAGQVFLSSSGERQSVSEVRPQRDEDIGTRQDTLSDFLSGDIDLTEFRSRVNQECANNGLWGFNGFSGMMFFNMLVSATEAVPNTNLPETLRSTLSPPNNKDEARVKIESLVEYVNHLQESLGDDDGSPPAAGSVPYFLSYFWQLDGPDRYPMYYKSMRDALSDLDLWAASGDHAPDYAAFWELNEEIRSVLEVHTAEDIHLWDIERLCLFWLNRDILTSPAVWVEKARPTEWEYGAPGSGFAYGEALWTAQQDSDGRNIYETLREPAVGDIVLHLSSEDNAILGTSIVDSELLTDFDLPEGAMWEEAHRERGGYLRELRDYRPLTPRFDIKSDLLRVDRLQPTLRQIAAEHSVFYTELLQLTPQAYVTEAPRELVELLARESPVLRAQLVDREYKIEVGPAGEYSDINEATEDVRTRLEHQDGKNPLRDSITSTLIEEWTSMLTGFEPNSDISLEDEVRGKQILSIYDGAEDEFQAQAATLGIGTLPPLSPAETLFAVTFRELQVAFDATANFN